MFKNTDFYEIFTLYKRGAQKELLNIPLPRLAIAYIELIAVLVGFSVLSKYQPNMLIALFSDNTDVIACLRKGRCSAGLGLGFELFAAIVFFLNGNKK